MKRCKMMTAEEVAAVDPQAVDSVTADRLIATIGQLRDTLGTTSRMYYDLVTEKVGLWLAIEQGDGEAAAEWITGDVENWIDDETLLDEWAHDWRKYIAAHEVARHDKRCMICADPVTTWGKDMAACSERHRHAIRGDLPDEQCRLCNTVTACAFDVDGSPVCSDCWPGERLLAERRASWARRWSHADDTGALR